MKHLNKLLEHIDKLQWIKKEIKQIENKIDELTVLKAVSFDGMPSGNSVSSPVEEYNERLDSLNRKLERRKAQNLEEEEWIEDYIEAIEDVEIRVLARSRFVECKSYKKIGDENFMDRTTVYRKLDKYFSEREGTKDASQTC